jgi:CheY-like chemotaxis protein
MPERPDARVAVVHDYEPSRATLTELLLDEGFDAIGYVALPYDLRNHAVLIINYHSLDDQDVRLQVIRMFITDGQNGNAFYESPAKAPPVIVLTATRPQHELEARIPHKHFLQEPFDADQLLDLVGAILAEKIK